MEVLKAIEQLVKASRRQRAATETLRDEAATVAAFLEEHVPPGIPLPRGYEVVEKVGGRRLLRWEGKEGAAYFNPAGTVFPDPFREALLQFARDISSGLLEEIAAVLERTAQEDEKAASVFRKAAQCLDAGEK